MPIDNGKYVNPEWANDSNPAIDADELNAISDTLELVPVANGGTGKETLPNNAVVAGNGTGAVKTIPSASGALYSYGSGLQPQFGTLPVPQGGTGKTSHTSNSVLVGNSSGTIKNVPSNYGALYSTEPNGEPQFGVLPVEQGGTGATTVAGARNALGLGNASGALPIANGGTGATTVAGARNALGLGNTSGALPVANGGTGSASVTSADVATGGGIRSGKCYKWGKVVTVSLITDQLASDELVSKSSCIPSGYRPSYRVKVVFGGSDHSNGDSSTETRGVLLGFIETNGMVVTCTPYQGSKKGYYHATVTYLLT